MNRKTDHDGASGAIQAALAYSFAFSAVDSSAVVSRQPPGQDVPPAPIKRDRRPGHRTSTEAVLKRIDDGNPNNGSRSRFA